MLLGGASVDIGQTWQVALIGYSFLVTIALLMVFVRGYMGLLDDVAELRKEVERNTPIVGASLDAIDERRGGTHTHSTLIEIRRRLTADFTEGEIKVFCFDQSIDYDNLEGETKAERVVSLINHLRGQSGGVAALTRFMQKSRPPLWAQADIT